MSELPPLLHWTEALCTRVSSLRSRADPRAHRDLVRVRLTRSIDIETRKKSCVKCLSADRHLHEPGIVPTARRRCAARVFSRSASQLPTFLFQAARRGAFRGSAATATTTECPSWRALGLKRSRARPASRIEAATTIRRTAPTPQDTYLRYAHSRSIGIHPRSSFEDRIDERDHPRRWPVPRGRGCPMDRGRRTPTSLCALADSVSHWPRGPRSLWLWCPCTVRSTGAGHGDVG